MDLKRYSVAADGAVTKDTETAGITDIAISAISNPFKEIGRAHV